MIAYLGLDIEVRCGTGWGHTSIIITQDTCVAFKCLNRNQESTGKNGLRPRRRTFMATDDKLQCP